MPIRIPDEATNVHVSGPGGFITRVRYEMPDGHVVAWGSRHARKSRSNFGGRGLNWWIGLIFAIGSACFAIGPIPAYDSLVGPRNTALTYFVGSLFFTTAAYLSYLEVIREAGPHRWFAYTPDRMGFWASFIQFIGTLFFNVTTFAAILTLSPDEAIHLIWRPDLYGSICFLVSSGLAFAEAGFRWWSWLPGHRDWHVTSLNWWGSVFFGISAIGAYILPGGHLLSTQWANGGTFFGALCFLAASVLMMPEGRAQPASGVGGPTIGGSTGT